MMLVNLSVIQVKVHTFASFDTSKKEVNHVLIQVLRFLTVTCCCCPYLYFGSPIM